MDELSTVVIPIAGTGSRFLPASKVVAKEMFPIIDKPVLHYTIQEAINAGFTKIIFINSRKKDYIKEYFNQDSQLEKELFNKNKLKMLNKITHLIPQNIKINYITQLQPLGLGHAILQARPYIHDKMFAVMLPDDLIYNDNDTNTLLDLKKAYHQYGGNWLLVQNIERQFCHLYGIINYHGKVENYFKINNIIEKPELSEAPSNWAVVGRYLLSSKIFNYLAKVKPDQNNEIQLTSAINSLALSEKIYGQILSKKHYDCGSKLGLVKATIDFALKDPEIFNKVKQHMATQLEEYSDT